MYDVLYLSPHLDDAALSCGGQIAQQTAAGRRVLVVTVMAGDPPGGDAPGGDAPGAAFSGYALALHDRWQLAHDAVAARRAEDIAACAILGAEHQHWPAPDCIYRLHPLDGRALYTDWAQITGDIHPAETALIDGLVERLADLPPCLRIIAPLAIGNHVDHQIVRQAAERYFGQTLMYYEDYPYVREPQALTAVIPPGDPGWQVTQIPLAGTAVQTKIEAIAAFASQLSTFFNSQADLEEQIASQAKAAGGERLWQRKIGHVGA